MPSYNKGLTRGVYDIMFLCTSRLPSFAPRAREMRGSANQNGAGLRVKVASINQGRSNDVIPEPGT